MPSVHLNAFRTSTLAAALIVPALLFKLKLYPSVESLTRFGNRLAWSVRCAVLPSPLPRKLDQWIFSERFDESLEERKSETARFYSYWKFLEQFFASRGYVFYTFFKPPTAMLVAVPSDPDIRRQNVPEYPYARRVYNKDSEALFTYSVSNFWTK
jgi:hypothetical protein